MKVTEKQIESALVDWVKRNQGVALKGATHFDTGYPDRIIYLPKASAYVEVKGTSTRYHLNDKQMLWAGRILASRQPYFILESMDALQKLKQMIYIDHSKYVEHRYYLNGFNLVLDIDDTRQTLSVTSQKNMMTKRILSMIAPQEPHYKIIYRVFKKLEELYPNTNYEDI